LESRGAERLYGFKRAEAIGREASDLLKTIYPIPLEAIEEILRRTEHWSGELMQRRSIPGTGLGLFLCREIARRHGGDILVESWAGAGSRFTLSVPARVNAGAGRRSTRSGNEELKAQR
jgi:signal transduction histidine kinase